MLFVSSHQLAVPTAGGDGGDGGMFIKWQSEKGSKKRENGEREREREREG